MSKKLTGVDGDGLVRQVLDAGAGEVRLFQPSASVLGSFVRVASEAGFADGELLVIAPSSVLKPVMDDFLVASGASALVERGVLDVRTAPDEDERSLVLLDDAVVSFVAFDGSVGALQSEDDELMRHARSAFEDRWETGQHYEIRTPPISRVMASLRDDIGPATAQDFADVLDELDTARGDGDGLDEIAIALLAAARNEVLLYDISKWGEDNGVASKATFSRKKTAMEDAGLIDTENVPIEIGRPRLRLTLADELQEASIPELVTATVDALS